MLFKKYFNTLFKLFSVIGLKKKQYLLQMWNLVLKDLTSSNFFRTTVEIKVIDNLELLQFFPFGKKKKLVIGISAR